MKTLHLTLKKKWFEMIASGEKTEEYREVKPYWNSRFTVLPPDWCKKCTIEQIEDNNEWYRYDFDMVEFKNGYGNQAPKIRFKFEYITISEGRPEWGAEPGVKYFVIKLGERIK